MYNILPMNYKDNQSFTERNGKPSLDYFNDFKILDESDFWRYMTINYNGPTLILSGYHLKNGWYAWGRAFWSSFHGHWMIALTLESLGGKTQVLYYTWSKCKHEYKTTRSSMTYKEYTCKLCGHVQTIDSSD